MNETVLCVLQNAWCDPKRPIWRSEKEWVRRLWLSHTGRRLKRMLPDSVLAVCINSTKKIGTTTRQTFAPDIKHIQAAYWQYRPQLVVGFGRIAQAGLTAAGIAHIAAPHPAWRQLSIAGEQQVRGEIEQAIYQFKMQNGDYGR